MLNNMRSAFIAFLLGFWGLLPNTAQQIPQEQKPSDHYAQAEPSIQPTQPATDQRAAEKKDDQQYPNWQRCLLDFCDRWGNAINAISTLVIAIFTVVLWWSTHKLWKSGEKHSERELRAYVGIDATSFLESVKNPKTMAEARVINAGQTPAYDLLINANFYFFSLPRKDFPLTTLERQSKITLFPQRTVRVPCIMELVVSDDNKRAIVAGKSAFFFYGKITYRDAFGKDRYTNFRFIADDDKAETVSWRATEEGNDST